MTNEICFVFKIIFTEFNWVLSLRTMTSCLFHSFIIGIFMEVPLLKFKALRYILLRRLDLNSKCVPFELLVSHLLNIYYLYSKLIEAKDAHV